MQYLLVRANLQSPSSQLPPEHPAHDDPDYIHHLVSGHSLMASCPGESQLVKILENPDVQHQIGMPDLDKASLQQLFRSVIESSKAVTGAVDHGEIVPSMAWQIVKNSGHLERLGVQGVEKVRNELVGKIRCYG